MQYPFSRDEHAAMSRYLSSIKKQLQDVSDLFAARYGENSSIAALATGSLVSIALLQHEFCFTGEDDCSPATSLRAGEQSMPITTH